MLFKRTSMTVDACYVDSSRPVDEGPQEEEVLGPRSKG